MTTIPQGPEDVLSQQHQDWLQHPVTQQLIKNLGKHRERFVSLLSSNAGRYELPETSFRNLGYAIGTLDAILELTKNTDKFVEQSKK